MIPFVDLNIINVLLGSGSGSVGRSDASNTRGFRF